jgi:hypothetical protein
VSNTSELRDLSQSAARIFGWGEGGMTVHANQALIVTQEQLEQIRQLREPVVNEAPQLEGRRPSLSARYGQLTTPSSANGR